MELEAARKYLVRAVPWPEDGDDFYVNIHWTRHVPEIQRALWTGRATRSVAEAARTLKWALGLEDTRDIYVCLSGQKEANRKTSRRGHEYVEAVRSQANVVSLKALWLDIDVKDKKGYPTQKEAVEALADFLKKTGLPKPSMIVTSGGGLHVYWTLSEAITQEQWQPVANALAEATKQVGLKCDTVCTVDSARVLRVPDTWNRKEDEPRPVKLASNSGPDYSFEYLAEKLEPYAVAAPAPSVPSVDVSALAPANAPSKPSDVQDELGAGIVTRQPVNLDLVAPNCAFISEAIETGGKEFDNPLWNLTTLIATFSKGGREDAHRMASGHPDYSMETTDALYDRKEREKEQKGLGWPACASIRMAGCSACDGCPLLTQGKSPLNHAVLPSPPSLPSDDLPEGFRRNHLGVVGRSITDDHGRTYNIDLLPYPMIDPWLTSNPWALNFQTITHKGNRALITIPLTSIATRDGLAKDLSAQGIMTYDRSRSAIREFFVAWVNKLQNMKDKVVTSASFGWNHVNGVMEGFVFGGCVWTPTGERPASNADLVLQEMYSPVGDKQNWQACAKMVTDQDRPELDAVLASAFAAPLVQFTGHEGAFMSLFSQESGIGKTTALKIAQAVWGNPVKAMQGLSDTQVSVVRKIGALRSLPIYWDELKTEEDTQRFVELTFQLTGGKEKSRAKSDASLRDIGTWKTMLVSASNESLVDHIASRTKQTTAGIYRIFEYEVAPRTKGAIDPSDAQRMLARLDNNFGNVGLEYAQWLGRNHMQIEHEVGEFARKLNTTFSAKEEERFWFTVMVVICMGARYANQLGFTQINEKALYDFMVATLERMRQIRRETHTDMRNTDNVVSIMSHFLNQARARHMLVTDHVTVSRGKVKNGTIQLKCDVSRLEDIWVRVATEDKLIRISSTSLGEWLKKHGYSRSLFISALMKDFGARKMLGMIGGGTPLRLPQEHLLEVDVMGTSIEPWFDDSFVDEYQDGGAQTATNEETNEESADAAPTT